MIRAFGGFYPQIAATAYIDDSAQIIGDVVIGEHSSVWPGVVIRGDVHYIRIGACCNIQDNSVLHVETDLYPVILADRVGVGHNAVLHGCRIETGSLIGMGAVILNNAVIGAGSMVAAGAVVPEQMVIPPGSLVMGIPAKVRREINDQDRQRIERNISAYIELKDQYLAERARK